MKKYIRILLVLILFSCVILYGNYSLNQQQTEQNTEHKKAKKRENPNPPDKEYMEDLGIEPFVSELPVLMIDTKGQQILKEDTIWTKVSVMDDPSGKNDILGKADDILTATIKYRGASSYIKFDKKQYRMKIYKKKNGKEQNYDLFGLGADSEWVLNGPFLDRSLLRNYLMYHLSEEVMSWAPSCTFFELFLNGEYQGVYLAVEPITPGAERLRLSRFGLSSGETPYIVKRDRMDTETNVIHTYGESYGYTGQQLSVDYPGEKKLTKKQLEWIEQDISSFERVLYSEYFADPDIGYAKYIDVDSFVDYFILNEFSMNHDAGVLSTYVYKELTGKLQLCVWDFNNAFDNYQWFPMAADQYILPDNYWFDRLVQDRGFVKRIVERYRELRKGALSDQNVQAVLDQGMSSLGDAVDRNFEVWGYTFEDENNYLVHEGVRDDPNNYEEAVEGLETTIAKRLAFMDENIELLYDWCIN